MIAEHLKVADGQSLLERLRGRIFHLTTREAYRKILKAGEISHNRDQRFPVNVGSQSSFGRALGYVCLFDLRDERQEIIENTLQCYYFLGPSWFCRHGTKYLSWDLVYLLLDPRYYDRIIPASRHGEHYRATNEYLQAVPHTEVWLENRIPLEWIEKTLLVKIRERAPDRNTPSGAHYWAVHEAWQRREKK